MKQECAGKRWGLSLAAWVVWRRGGSECSVEREKKGWMEEDGWMDGRG